VIPAMPAIAMLIALHWRDIARAWFVPTLLLALPAPPVLTRLAWVGHGRSAYWPRRWKSP
jgi:hypothetical protein